MNTRVPTRRWQAGFTLAELLLVVAIITILVDLLLPAVQTVRTAANAERNRSNLSLVVDAVNRYRQLNNHAPTSIAQLGQSGLSDELLSGTSGGYVYTLINANRDEPIIQGVPAAPGQTGIESCSMNSARVLECYPTPNAALRARIMWMRVAALSAQSAANLVLRYTPGVTGHTIAESLASPATANSVFNQLDGDRDGVISPSEITHSIAIVPSELVSDYGSFLAGIEREMALGVANEHIDQLPGATIRDLSSQQPCGTSRRSFCDLFPNE